jgi:manganese transport protein
MTVLPIIKKQSRKDTLRLHPDAAELQHFAIPEVSCIAIALDFSRNDERLIAHALSQGSTETKYFLLHIVESASARTLGDVSDDYETRKDKEHMQSYVDQLQRLGYKVEGRLGYQNRIREIVRLVKEAHANLLVMGAHRHTGVMDYLYGETVERVRHQVKIPVLIVN